MLVLELPALLHVVAQWQIDVRCNLLPRILDETDKVPAGDIGSYDGESLAALPRDGDYAFNTPDVRKC